MILRTWRAVATEVGAAAYTVHFRAHVLPLLIKTEGFRDAYLARRPMGDDVEMVVLSLWESLDAIRSFAGSDFERAVVHPDAASVLVSYDGTVRHEDIVATASMVEDRG